MIVPAGCKVYIGRRVYKPGDDLPKDYKPHANIKKAAEASVKKAEVKEPSNDDSQIKDKK